MKLQCFVSLGDAVTMGLLKDNNLVDIQKFDYSDTVLDTLYNYLSKIGADEILISIAGVLSPDATDNAYSSQRFSSSGLFYRISFSDIEKITHLISVLPQTTHCRFLSECDYYNVVQDENVIIVDNNHGTCVIYTKINGMLEDVRICSTVNLVTNLDELKLNFSLQNIIFLQDYFVPDLTETFGLNCKNANRFIKTGLTKFYYMLQIASETIEINSGNQKIHQDSKVSKPNHLQKREVSTNTKESKRKVPHEDGKKKQKEETLKLGKSIETGESILDNAKSKKPKQKSSKLFGFLNGFALILSVILVCVSMLAYTNKNIYKNKLVQYESSLEQVKDETKTIQTKIEVYHNLMTSSEPKLPNVIEALNLKKNTYGVQKVSVSGNKIKIIGQCKKKSYLESLVKQLRKGFDVSVSKEAASNGKIQFVLMIS